MPPIDVDAPTGAAAGPPELPELSEPPPQPASNVIASMPVPRHANTPVLTQSFMMSPVMVV